MWTGQGAGGWGPWSLQQAAYSDIPAEQGWFLEF